MTVEAHVRKFLRAQLSRRVIIWVLAPILGFLSLAGWALASPIGASPDDDYHQVSIWCANPAKTWACEPGSSADTRIVPRALVESVCFAQKPDVSAQCQVENSTLDSTPTVETDSGNFVGAYPPFYYLLMNNLVSPDIQLSVMLMRLLNALIFVGLGCGLWLLLPIERRHHVGLTWLVSTVPLGIFLIPSLNPSSWAIMAIPTAWFALTGYLVAQGKTRTGLAVFYVIAGLMAAGSRSDAAIYLGFTTLLALFAAYRPKKSNLTLLILPAAMLILAGISALAFKQTTSGLNGFGSSADAIDPSTGAAPNQPIGGLANIAFNLIQLPSLWAGAFGDGGLGWLDTQVPAIVTYGGVACFVLVVAKGLEAASRRTQLVFGIVAAALIAIPIWVLFKGKDFVGQNVQTRYILPLIVLLVAVSLFTQIGQRFELRWLPRFMIWGTLTVTNFVSLYVNMHRYLHGASLGSLNLDVTGNHWWPMLSLTAVLTIASISFAVLIALLLRPFSRTGRLIEARTD